ncbi:DNA-binding protein [Bifidobacterium saguini DSM 23967]|uniref:DNA-binding protein n=2 Tax=Bifidobacterium saguini TaxID=762210 RepID=A0A087D6N3_9BIFI|nr:DNA-binding protein [Bifidobacterium saguini DSM 23967]
MESYCIMQCMGINDWFVEVTGGESYNAVAKKAGVQASSIWRQLPDRLSEKNAVAIARAYGRPAIEPLIVMGLLTDDDVKAIKSQDALRDATDDELMAELSRRIKANADPKWQEPPNVD